MAATSNVKLSYESTDLDIKNVIDECSGMTGAVMKVSTMTILTELDHELDLSLVTSSFMDEKIQAFIKEVLGYPQAITVKTGGKRFFNCLIFKLCDKQSVKVFCNGNLHITGVKCIKDAIEISEIFGTMFELMYGGSGVEDVFKVDRFAIQMINIYFKLPFLEGDNVINLPVLLETLKKHSEYFCTYNNVRHAGVIVRMIPVTLLIFDSGNVIITAAVTPALIKTSVEFLFGFFEKHKGTPELIVAGEEPAQKKKKVVDYSKYVDLK